MHLSRDVETAARVGGRRGRAVVLVVDAAAMQTDGASFWRTDDDVWLTDAVAPRYLSIETDEERRAGSGQELGMFWVGDTGFEPVTSSV